MDLTVCSKRTTAMLSAVGQSLTINVSDASSAIIEMTTSALSGHNVTFEVSNDAKEDASGSWDGVSGNWRAILGQRTNAPSTLESVTGALAATPIYSWMLSVGGFKYLRIRVTAHTSGSATWSVTSTDAAMIFNAAVPPSVVTLNTGTSVIGDVGGFARATTGGLATASRLASSAASTNATVAKSSAGRLYRVQAFNNAANLLFLKIYNKATTPTVGTDTPIATLALPSKVKYDLDFDLIGLYCSLGISFAITANAADNDTTAIAAGDVVGLNIWYA